LFHCELISLFLSPGKHILTFIVMMISLSSMEAMGNVTQSLIKNQSSTSRSRPTQAADVAMPRRPPTARGYAASGIFHRREPSTTQYRDFSLLLEPQAISIPSWPIVLLPALAQLPALGCQTIFGLTVSPVNQTVNGDCIVVAATIKYNSG